jgi:hypothetical protein
MKAYFKFKSLTVLILWGFIFSFSACTRQIRELVNRANLETYSEEAGEDEEEEDRALKYEADTTYYNGWLGFSYTIPKGWWLYQLNSNNFSEDPEVSGAWDTLDINYGTDRGFDYSYLMFVSFANLQYSFRDNHIGFFISAESLDGINTIEEYMEYYEKYILEPDSNTYELLESDSLKLGGVIYERRVFDVIQEGGSNYHYLCITRLLKDGYFFTIRTSYWPQNKNAERIIQSAIAKSLSFGG